MCHPRPPAHIFPGQSTCSVGAILRGRYGPPGPQCIHCTHRGPPRPPHAQPRARSARGLHGKTTGSQTPMQHVSAVDTPTLGPPHHGGNTNVQRPTTPATAPRTCHSNEQQVQGRGPHSHPAHRCGRETNRGSQRPRPSENHPIPGESNAQPNASPPAGGHADIKSPSYNTPIGATNWFWKDTYAPGGPTRIAGSHRAKKPPTHGSHRSQPPATHQWRGL